jgi:hypothetical protein
VFGISSLGRVVEVHLDEEVAPFDCLSDLEKIALFKKCFMQEQKTFFHPLSLRQYVDDILLPSKELQYTRQHGCKSQFFFIAYLYWLSLSFALFENISAD